ncbi:MAG: pyridoxamine 5'-phosphate oxidase family protein [Rickettsiales bacterium]|nr:pyridoxamine 5'-phosphate oxidase family protein [Rickettsiales bacterium]
MQDIEKILHNILKSNGTSLIGSIDADGFPNIKAMLVPRKIESGAKVFWFSTNTSSKRVAQFQKNSNACIYFYSPRFFKGVMLTGKMEVKTDAKSKEMLWETGDEMYYSKGVTDPDYCVLKFTANKTARYYSDFHSDDLPLNE